MAEQVYTQFENENSTRNYPFSCTSSFMSESCDELPADFIVDASVYTRGETCRLASISGTDTAGVCKIIVMAGSEELTGQFGDNDTSVKIFDGYGIYRGVLILGAGASSVAVDPSLREYSNLVFLDSCSIRLPGDFVTSVNVAGTDLTGDVTFTGDASGRTAIRPVSSQNDDGSAVLRFDVVANTGLSTLSNTGIRVVHILRKPGSLFNVIEKNGNPYLFLTKTGLMSKNSLIDRTSICSKANNKGAVADSVEKSSTEDCGNSSESDSSHSASDSALCQPFSTSWKGTYGFVESNDPYSVEYGTIKNYGYFFTASNNNYGTNPSMSLLFVEGNISVSFIAFNHAVLASVNYRKTEDAIALFYKPGDDLELTAWNIPLKYNTYRAFYDFFYSNRHGKLGYIDRDYIVDVCKSRGWYADQEDIVFPDDVDGLEFSKNLTDELRSSGFSKEKPLYTIRARDFFDHFKCKNWEVSSSDFLGDEVRWLVGWGPRDKSGFFSDDSSFSYVTLSDKNTGAKIKIPKWMAARAVWWHKYSKNGSEVRHFIVPRERGLVIYTGSYSSWYAGVSPGTSPIETKELSPSSWDCGHPPVWQTTGLVTQMARNDYRLWKNAMREQLYKEYAPDYSVDGEPADSITFYKFNYETMSDDCFEIDSDELDRLVLTFPNRVTDTTLVVQPEDAPIYAEGADDRYKSGDYWLGPFEYEYDKLYVPGKGYPEPGDDDWKEAEAIKAPIAFQFDITKDSKNSFNIDTTDLTANGISYQNPIHIKASESVSSPVKLDISDPTDSSEVSDRLSSLVSGQTTGNGIEISIPGSIQA